MTSTIVNSQTEVLEYTQSLCEALEIDYRLYTTKSHRYSMERGENLEYHGKVLAAIADGVYDFNCKFVIESGRKYHKVVMIDGGGHKSVHCFVDMKTGDVFKSASWKAPAKGQRFNLLNGASRDHCYHLADWSGQYLYR